MFFWIFEWGDYLMGANAKIYDNPLLFLSPGKTIQHWPNTYWFDVESVLDYLVKASQI